MQVTIIVDVELSAYVILLAFIFVGQEVASAFKHIDILSVFCDYLWLLVVGSFAKSHEVGKFASLFSC